VPKTACEQAVWLTERVFGVYLWDEPLVWVASGDRLGLLAGSEL
jgi:hypothetical protein